MYLPIVNLRSFCVHLVLQQLSKAMGPCLVGSSEVRGTFTKSQVHLRRAQCRAWRRTQRSCTEWYLGRHGWIVRIMMDGSNDVSRVASGNMEGFSSHVGWHQRVALQVPKQAFFPPGWGATNIVEGLSKTANKLICNVNICSTISWVKYGFPYQCCFVWK